MKFGINSMMWASPFRDAEKLFMRAKSYGADVFEIACEDLSLLFVDEINKAKEKVGMDVATVTGAFGPSRDLSSSDPKIRESGIAYMKATIDFCEKIGAKVLAGPAYAATGKARQQTPAEVKIKWDLAVENLKICGEYADKKKIKIAIEPLNRFETDFINTVEQGIELINKTNSKAFGFLLDTFHMNIEENDIAKAIKLAGTESKIYDFHACANDRGIPGKDNFDWRKIADALKEVEYNDYIIIESFTPECKEIAKAASVWRPFAKTKESIAAEGIPFLRKVFS
ncbi:MAG: sugar phosphate isomerase/epimerase [Clostridiales Family XIII bacterium]|nr:sugar phosphate isomerase/epimerase [Clostridiales Family XIII bacterium]